MLHVTRQKIALACVAAGIAATSGCSNSGSTSRSSSGEHFDAGTAADASAARPQVAVTADWLHHTLSFIDFDAMVTTTQPDAGMLARTGEMDLSQYEQAPYGVKLTPDGKTAVVTLSAGYFVIPGAGALLLHDSTIPSGPGKVLIVDVASKSIKAELDSDGPAGIAITHDGKKAFISHVATPNVSVIDIEAGTVLQEVDIGGGFAEAVAVDDTDSVVLVTGLGTGLTKNARTFAVADPAGTLSEPFPLDNDAAGVSFFPGTKVGFVVLAYSPLGSTNSGYALIDASDVHAPVKLIETKWTDEVHVAFDVLPAPTRGTLLMPVATGGNLEIREYGLGTGDVELKSSYPVAALTGFGPFGSVLDRKGRILMTLPGDRELGVLDLGTGSAFTVPWFKEPGPMGIDLH